MPAVPVMAERPATPSDAWPARALRRWVDLLYGIGPHVRWYRADGSTVADLVAAADKQAMAYWNHHLTAVDVGDGVELALPTGGDWLSRSALVLQPDERGVSVRVVQRLTPVAKAANSAFITLALVVASVGIAAGAVHGDPTSLAAVTLYVVGRGINGFNRSLRQIPADDLVRALRLTSAGNGS